MEITKKNQNITSLILALIVMALWGSLFPFIKIGYQVFEIDSSSIPDILMFAGVRFTLCGILVGGFSILKKEKPGDKKDIKYILLVGLFTIVLHYTFTYIGLALADGSKTSIIKQLGTLLYVCFSFLFIRSEKFSVLKIIGALIGFTGIIAINIGSGGFSFSVGETVIILASVCTVIASLITKLKLEQTSPFRITGMSQFTGGIVLVACAYAMGADMLTFNLKSFLVFAYICTASITGYILWYYVLKNSSLSKLFIIKFSEPLFACVFSAVLLGEDILKPQYLIAFILISSGIILGNRN